MALLYLLGVVAVVLGTVLFLMHRYEKQRTGALESVAAELGLTFSVSADEQLLQKLKVFPLFNRGLSRRMHNVMKAEQEMEALTVFDYMYHDALAKRNIRHSVIAFESDSLSLPSFSLQPESVFNKIGAAVGFQDIDFEGYPEFSRSFLLKGENEEATRRFFDPEILQLFPKRKGLCVDSAPGVFIYRQGGRKKPEEMDQFMRDGFEIYSAFKIRAKR